MPVRRKTPRRAGTQVEWAMLLSGFVLSLAGGLLWLISASRGWQIIGFVLLLWGVSAGVRALAGFVKTWPKK